MSRSHEDIRIAELEAALTECSDDAHQEYRIQNEAIANLQAVLAETTRGRDEAVLFTRAMRSVAEHAQERIADLEATNAALIGRLVDCRAESGLAKKDAQITAMMQERAEAVATLKANLDRDWEPETSLRDVVSIAANGLYWRQREIANLKQSLAEVRAERDEMDRAHAGVCVEAARNLAEVRGALEWRPVTATEPSDGLTVIVPGGVGYRTGGRWRTITGFDWPGQPITWAVEVWMPLPTVSSYPAPRRTEVEENLALLAEALAEPEDPRPWREQLREAMEGPQPDPSKCDHDVSCAICGTRWTR